VVISIGNITTGGTGKTPLVIQLCKSLQQKNLRCAVLTRGYKTHTSNENQEPRTDEPAILSKSCPAAKVIVNPDRVEAASDAVNKFGSNVLIMDDGFQHRRLERDVDIITMDAIRPFGYGKILPAGLLREPITALKRADAVVLTRCDQASDAELSKIEERLRLTSPDIIIARSIHRPVCVKSFNNKEIAFEELKNKKVFAFCGIANPDAFLRTIEGLRAHLAGSKIYNDHHHYSKNDVADISERAKYLNADLILTTEKDCSKTILLAANKKEPSFAYLVIELTFNTGEDKITQLIEEALAGKILEN
jgi:tetraacyldisaccharide 4'-kinase